MNFNDSRNSFTELVFHRAVEVDYMHECSEQIVTAVSSWKNRKNLNHPGFEYFKMDNCTSFTITCDGSSDHYWPDQDKNLLPETLIREFLFQNGICQVQNIKPTLYRANIDVIAIPTVEYILICPYQSSHGVIEGILAVCITHPNNFMEPINANC